MAQTTQPQLIVPPGAEWGPGFSVARATDAYIATVPAAARMRSDAYFEGGYWIGLWGVVITVALAWVLLASGFSARLRDLAEGRFRRPNLRVLGYVVVYLVVTGLVTLPWDLYTGYFREHAYGMSNQDLAGFLRDWAVGGAVGTVLGSLALVGIYAIIRRLGRRWVPWATLAAAGFMYFVILIAPVFIEPLFNDYKPLPAGPVRDSILELAHANGIPVHDVYWFNASKQTKRISANVSGVFGTTRIALNDNLLDGTSLPEIRAVMAHEMGHFVLHHSLWLPLGFAVVIGFGLWVVDLGFARVVTRRGPRWGVRGLADPAGLPLLVALFSVVMYLLTPVTNSLTRTAENQADAFGLDAAHEPYGFASVAMRLATYRKLEPSPLEEIIFFDHPSGRHRVERAMRWLAEHPPGPKAPAPAANPP